MAFIHIKFKLTPGGQELGEVKVASVVPSVGDAVLLQSEMRLGGQVRYQVVGVEHYYTDMGARDPDAYVPKPVWVTVMESRNTTGT